MQEQQNMSALHGVEMSRANEIKIHYMIMRYKGQSEINCEHVDLKC